MQKEYEKSPASQGEQKEDLYQSNWIEDVCKTVARVTHEDPYHRSNNKSTDPTLWNISRTLSFIRHWNTLSLTDSFPPSSGQR